MNFYDVHAGQWHTESEMLSPAKTIAPQDWMTAPATAAVMRALTNDRPDPAALFVGGCVRNTLLGRPVDDIDIATVWIPDEATARLQAAGIKVVPTGVEHGTVTAVADGRPFEITTLRRDVATDGRRAVVAFTDDWVEDAQRRDFTMNTLLADTAGHIYDPTGQGLADLIAGRVLFVGDPAQRIAEDYLRILRFFRFHAYYGQEGLDKKALAACQAAAAHIPELSRERITQEFMKLLALDDPAPILQKMFNHKILTDLPQAGYKPEVLSRFCILQRQFSATRVDARLAVLTDSKRRWKALEKYLVLTNTQKKLLDQMFSAFLSLDNTSEKSLKTFIYKYKNELSTQAALFFFAQRPEADTNVFFALRDWRPPVFPITGDDAKGAGVAPGPEMGKLLQQLEAWWIENDFRPDRTASLKQLKKFMF